MAIYRLLLHIISCTLILTVTVSVSVTVSVTDPPRSSPSPSPQSASDNLISVTSSSPPPSIVSPPAPPPSIGSPPAPPPSDLANPPPSSVESTPPSPSTSPSPLPSEASDVTADVKSEEHNKSSSGGMSTGKKVGVAFGLFAAACVVGFGGVLYRKRQQNIRRAQYSQSARLEFF